MAKQIMVKNIRLSDRAYEYLAKHVVYPESMSDTIERMLGIKESGKEKSKKC